MNPTVGASSHHLLTIDLEDYYQAVAFRQVIDPGSWYRFESRLGTGVGEALRLLDRHAAGATFFVAGWVAERFPEVVREVADRGHEVASAGFGLRDVTRISRSEFRDDLARSRAAIERASGRAVIGYRNPLGQDAAESLRAREVLAEEGYAYDASQPLWKGKRTPGTGRDDAETVPALVPTVGEATLADGRELRRRPRGVLRGAIARRVARAQEPLALNVRAWELDPNQPRIMAIPPLARFAHYHNLERTASALDDVLSSHRFRGIAAHLGLSLAPRASVAGATRSEAVAERREGTSAGAPATVVIPCYNEEFGLRYLSNTLESVRNALQGRFELRLIFVDDGSTDDTWRVLGEVFGGWPGVALVRHEGNQGVAAAILTGIQRATTEVVCSIDCDCTYDPHDLAEMIPLLVDGVDLVTASPYHPRGAVLNVPCWRLLLSRGASALYRRVLGRDIRTFTSCFRVYRRGALVGLDLAHPGFLGVAEVLGRLVLGGSGVVEYPTTLRVRVLGRSKMKIVRTIFAHAGLLARLLRLRLEGVSTRPGALLVGPALTDPAIEA